MIRCSRIWTKRRYVGRYIKYGRLKVLLTKSVNAKPHLFAKPFEPLEVCIVTDTLL